MAVSNGVRVLALLLGLGGVALGQAQSGGTSVAAAPATTPTAATRSTHISPEPPPGPEAEPLEKTEPQLPNSPSYHALTSQDKFRTFVRRTYSPYTFTSVLFNATYSQAVGDWPTYGGGMQGYGKRFGAILANTEASNLFRVFLFPTLFREDPRYYPSGKKGLVPRGWYAATRVLVGRKDDGRSTFNYSEILGTTVTASLTNAYYPRRERGFADTVSRSFGAVTSDAGSNVLREFWPDIRRIFHKHEPESLKKIEAKLPMEKIERATGTGPEGSPTPTPPATQPGSSTGAETPQSDPKHTDPK